MLPATAYLTSHVGDVRCPICSGASCPYSHGDGFQTADDVAAALIAAAYFADPDVQMAAAIEASLVDVNRSAFDDSELPQYKRDYHVKEQRLRKKVCAGGQAGWALSLLLAGRRAAARFIYSGHCLYS